MAVFSGQPGLKYKQNRLLCSTKRKAVLFIFIWDVLHDVLNFAAQYFAKRIDCVCADAFVSFQAGDLARADMVFVDQCILRDALRFHCVP